MKHHRERAWMCANCGYAMDSASAIDGSAAVPNDGDISLCLNCGVLYVRQGIGWQQMSAAERRTLPLQTRLEISQARRARAAVIHEDVSKQRGGSA
jgi:hypothetical protein